MTNSATANSDYKINEDIGINYLDDIVRSLLPYQPIFKGEYTDDNALGGKNKSIEAILKLTGIPYDHFEGDITGNGHGRNIFVGEHGNEKASISKITLLFNFEELNAVARTAAGMELSVDDYEIAKRIAGFNDGEDSQHKVLNFLDDVRANEKAAQDVCALIDIYIPVEQALTNALLNMTAKYGVLSTGELTSLIDGLREKSDPNAIVSVNNEKTLLLDVIAQYAETSSGPR